MRYTIILLISLFSLAVFSQTNTCDADFIRTAQKMQHVGFDSVESELHDILKRCPDHYDSHTVIRAGYSLSYTSIPIMTLLWQNMADPYSKQARKNFKELRYYQDRFLSFSSGGTSVHVAPRFVMDWDSVFENNMSWLEAGFILTGAIYHAPQFQGENSAEKMREGFNKVFLKIDSVRPLPRCYGFYYDFYVDFFIALYKSEQFTTGLYLSMYGSKEKEIKQWVQTHQTEIDSFYAWREEYLTQLKKMFANQ